MGFTSGFAGGVTLTLAVAYYTVITHERNRQAQAVALRSSSRTLKSLFEPQPPLGPTRAELLQSERSTLLETAKDRWNSEIERAVRSIQNANWEEIRERRDEAFAKVLGESLDSARHGIEKAEKEIGKTTSAIEGKAEKALSKRKEKAAAKASELKKEVPAKAEQVRTEISKSSAGTVDAARGLVRNTISKSIEKGKELVGKAHDAVGAATSGIESKSLDGKSEAEKLLEERYKPIETSSSPLDRLPEEILAERYKSTA